MRRATTPNLSVLIPMLLTLAGGAGAATVTASTGPLLGFNADGATAQRALEQRFDAQLKADDQREWMRQMAAEPNQVGSAHDKANAEFMLRKFKEWGWDARIETFDVLYPTLKSHALELVEPTRFSASLKEPPIAGDASSAKADGGLPPYNVYGADGDVTAELVYANYGMPDDYKELARQGVDVKGKIVITRYGHGWRGLKPKLAYEHGAVGCLIYSDPHEDGYFAGDVYPKGGWRPADGVQRGSVADMTLYPGDPLTPGVGATANAKRLSVKDAKTVLKIPVMPISYADAQPLLAALGGPVAPRDWRGALPLTYHVGPGPAKVHLKIESDWTHKPVYDVIATLRGAQVPDQWIVRGNHHDGWVFGAWDPLAGNVAMLAEAKAIGALVKLGWKPARTLVYASWDGEEPGLLGSTEWAETHADELKNKAVLYLNTDTNSRGFLSAEGSHSLQHLVNQVAADVRDPETGVSVQQRLRAALQVEGFDNGANAESKRVAKLAASDADLPIGGLGSGSDYSAFLQHLGIASINIGYEGEEQQGGVYHSNYDTFEHYERFGDPGFAYGVALAQTAGRIVLRAADAEVLPLRFGDFADTVARYTDEVHKLADSERERSMTLDHLLDIDAFKLAADPTLVSVAPPRDGEVPYIDFAPLDNALVRLQRSAKGYDSAYGGAAASGLSLSAAQRQQVNALLQGMEQTLLDAKGLPGRPWFQHFVYAPGMNTGYGVKTLPGVREAIEERQWDEASREVTRTAAVLNAYSARIDQAKAALR
ncbi:MAG: transferrin receptor-like dimerization domain-containing protein [Dokdonella sp.]